MKQYYLIDEEGYFIGDSLAQTENSVDVRPPQPCWKPRWDFELGEWVEEASEEEMNPTPVEPEPTVEERVEILEEENATMLFVLIEKGIL